jgi:hypothetical protein
MISQLTDIHTLTVWFQPLYDALYFFWPICLVFFLRNHPRVMARLITLWTVSGVLTVGLVVTNLSLIPLLPEFGPEPYNTIILVSLRLALLVLLASLLVRPKVSLQRV